LADFLHSMGAAPIIGTHTPGKACDNSNVNLEPCDIRNGADVHKLIESAQPEVVYHLAGSSDEGNPANLIKTNIEGTWNLLNACRQLQQPPRILLVGSAAGYGSQVAELDALHEDPPIHPNSFYGFSREAELNLGRMAHLKWGLPVFLCRPFNLIGPGLSERYAPAAILRRLLATAAANQTVFPVRNGDVVRDFVDVRDVVRAYWLIVQQGAPGVIYNIGSGRGVSIAELTQKLAIILDRQIHVVPEPVLKNSERSQIRHSVANHRRLSEKTGWQPEIPLEQSLKDMVREMTTVLPHSVQIPVAS
jgi:GDP-4-dehydro-6-deoxy-D-mannose reductase